MSDGKGASGVFTVCMVHRVIEAGVTPSPAGLRVWCPHCDREGRYDIPPQKADSEATS